MSGLIDGNGNEVHTKEDANETADQEGKDGTPEPQTDPRAASIQTEQGYFVIKLPIHNNLYQTLGWMLWAEDQIRGIYMEAKMRKAQSGLAKPNGFLKGFRNRWK